MKGNERKGLKVSKVSIPNSRIWHVNWSGVRCVEKQIWKTNDRKKSGFPKVGQLYFYHPLEFSREWAHFIHYPFTNHFWTWNECKAHEWYWRTDWQWPVAVQCFFLESGWASLWQQNRETLVSPVILLHIFPLEWLIAALWWIEEASPFYLWWFCAFCDESLEEAYYGVSHPESLSPGCQDGCGRQGCLLHCAITSFSWISEDHG